MALTDENLGTTMLVQPSYGGIPYGGNLGGGLLGGNNDLLGLLFVIALCNGGWGGGFGFGGGWGMGRYSRGDETEEELLDKLMMIRNRR